MDEQADPAHEPITSPNRIGPYLLKQVIGDGNYSVVKLAVHELTGENFACKIVPKKRLAAYANEARFELEVRILTQLNHPFIARLIELFKDSINYYIILELCENGTLFQYISRYKKIEIQNAQFIFTQIAQALCYLHTHGIAHRDIKPENILIAEDNSIKLIDFGFSGYFNQDHLTSTTCGSPAYCSPECISSNLYNGQISDMWSAGVVLYVMIFGHLPWTKTNQKQQLMQIIQGEFFISTSINPSLRDLLMGLMELDVNRRLTSSEVLSHPWVNGDMQLTPSLNNCLAEGQYTANDLDSFFDKETVNKAQYASSFIVPKPVDPLDPKSLLGLARRKTFHTRRLVRPKYNPSRSTVL